jgi:capsular exopolysaccharide synthesis family protein
MTPGKSLSRSKQTDPAREMELFDENGNGYGKRAVYVETIDQPPSSENGAALFELWHLLRGHIGVIAAIGVLGAIAGALLTLYQTPLYRAKATLEVQPPLTSTMGFASPQQVQAEASEVFIRTQTKILLSRALKDRVIQKLADTNRLSAYTPPDKLAKFRSMLHLPVAAAATKDAAESPTRFPGCDFKVDGDTTHIMDLTCDSADPKFAADYVNTVADEFGRMQLETRWEAAKRTQAWLLGQLADNKEKLENSEARLREYVQTSGILITDGKSAIPEEKLREIQHELSVASGERIDAQAAYEVKGKNVTADTELDDERLGAYHIQLDAAQEKLSELSAIFTDEHPEVIAAKAAVTNLQGTIKREEENYLAKIRNAYLAAQRREDLLTDSYANQSKIVGDHASRMTVYDILKREVDTDQELYSALLQKVRESGVSSAFSAENVHLVDSAEIPGTPFRPSMLINVTSGFFGALLLGVGLVVLGDQVNRSLKAPGESSVHLRVPELGVIPAYEGSAQVLSGPKLLDPGSKKSAEVVELAMRNDAQSLVAESFRNVLTSILLSDAPERRPRVIVVTAAGRQAGKSSSVSNLALALAEIGQKVLVIDADLRRPRQHLIFDTSNSWGLSDILQERTPLQDIPLEAIARPLDTNGLYLLPAGPACANVSSLLYSDRVADLLQRVRREFDTILIDTPPVLMVADARIMGRVADAAILVIRAGQTTRDVAYQAKQRLVDDGITVLGSILNRWRLKSKTRYTNYHYESEA